MDHTGIQLFKKISESTIKSFLTKNSESNQCPGINGKKRQGKRQESMLEILNCMCTVELPLIHMST